MDRRQANREQRGHNKDEEVLELNNEWIPIACWKPASSHDDHVITKTMTSVDKQPQQNSKNIPSRGIPTVTQNPNGNLLE
jgi:hypothetical protein